MNTQEIFGKIFDYKLNGIDSSDRIEIEKKNYDFSTNSNSEKTTFESGIKSIDVFTPLTFGGISKISGPSWCGKLVLEMELIRNFLKTVGGKVIWLAVEERSREWQDILLEFKECNLAGEIVSVLTKANDSQEIFSEALNNTISLAEELAKNEKVLLVIDDRVLDGEIKFFPNLQNGQVLTLVSCFPEHKNSENLNFDSEIILNGKLAKKGIYPAVDVIASKSKVLSEAQKEVTAKVQKLFVNGNFPDFAESETQAQRIQNFLTQFFFVAQLYTGKPGVFVKKEEGLKDLQELLENGFQGLDPKEFLYKGNLESITETA
ncbi:MAG: hypothetical protein DWQ06_06585 [Calditrichaeota bacterium]|nr:MAG: hypothetical protein DWQ06_06585 [Calditrichota bacterium]